MKDSNFNRLIQRYLSGQVSERERIKIEAWLELMKTEDTTTLKLSEEEEEELFRKITGKTEKTGEVIPLPAERRAAGKGWMLKIAASLIILSIASYLAWYLTDGKPDNLQTPISKAVEKVILNDGTIVWLHGGSKLVSNRIAGEDMRYTELNGEAFFEVAKDPDHPFVIKCGEVMLEVLGTSFNVRSVHDSVELMVLTGKVSFSTKADEQGIEVEPNEKAIYTRGGGIKKFGLEEVEVLQATADTQYDMKFINAPMEEVAERIGGKFNVTIVLSNKDIGKCHITADFTDHSLDSTLMMIAEVLDVECRKDGSSIVVSGTGCK